MFTDCHISYSSSQTGNNELNFTDFNETFTNSDLKVHHGFHTLGATEVHHVQTGAL